MWLCVDPLQDGKLPASVLRKDNIFNAVSVNVIAGAAANGEYRPPNTLWSNRSTWQASTLILSGHRMASK
jgi:hypothetical protein